MLVPNNIYNLIDDIIERSYQGFTYSILGKDFLTKDQQTELEALGLLVGNRPLLELVYLLVKQRSEGRYQADVTLHHLLESIFATGVIAGLSDVARATIDNAEQAMGTVIERTKADVKTAIKYQVTQFNQAEQAHARQNGFTTIPARKEREESQLPLLLLAIGAAIAVSQKAFHRDFTTELTTLVNQAAIDSAVDKYSAFAVAAGEVYCMKKVTLDDRTSEHCKHYYLNRDGSPTIYKLSELIANGVNDLKNKKSWKAVACADHPRCRSQLIILGTNPNLPT